MDPDLTRPSIRRAFPIIIGFLVVGISFNQLKNQLSHAAINQSELAQSREAQLFETSAWINDHLSPMDGSIGFFYLGVSFHLSRFEISDFLGKADEDIATSPVKWGPPGHNKWNFERSISKWNPQAILPASSADYTITGAERAAATRINQKADFSFAADLILNSSIRKNYSYCYIIPTNNDHGRAKYGFFIRNDIAIKFHKQVYCVGDKPSLQPTNTN